MFALNLLKRGPRIYQANYMNKRSKIVKAKFKDGGEWPTFNDYPAPCGPWKKNYDRHQTIYNSVLISGIIASIGAAILMGMTANFNFIMPEYPYKEEKDENDAPEQEGEE
uniref:Deltamethrin resistance protein prag01 domain-containing protein n=1 Tax=Glossina brevipalpis TaxID=37001 RepID=A0A1A9WIU7_9MUSC